jgi:hypothetical protein
LITFVEATIAVLNSKDELKVKYHRFLMLHPALHVELNAKLWGDPPSAEYILTPKCRQIWEFYKTWMCFSQNGTPYEKYKVIVEEALDFLRKFLESDAQEFESFPGYNVFHQHVIARYNELVAEGVIVPPRGAP